MRMRGLVLFVSFVLFGCGSQTEPEFETRVSELRIPGPWDPPATTRAIAATQYVPVVDPPAVSPQGSCSSSNAFACSCSHPSCSPAHAGTVELEGYLRARFPYLRSGGLYCCRQNSAKTSVPKLSVHAIGRAIDLMVTLEGGDADNAAGDAVANWLVENAEFIGIQRVIWDKAYWNGERGFGLLSSASLSHTNHIHVELSIAGAAKQTPFFTSGASAGSCEAHCEGSRIINADCSSGDCAFYGAECVPGAPPTCGPPPPPEPPEAVPVADATVPGVSSAGPAGRLTFVPPTRLFDTRTDAASTGLTRGDGSFSGPLTAGENVYTASGLPAGATALWLNVAAVPLADPGFLTLYPAGTPEPATSNVNYAQGRVRANAVGVSLGGGDRVAISALSGVDAIADLTGVFTPSGDGLAVAGPTRVLDTRSNDFALMPEEVVEVELGAPAGATGVVAMVAVISEDEAGFLTAFDCGTVPTTSNINYSADSVVANTVLSPLSTNGTVCLRASSQVHVVVDVTGFSSPDGPLSYQPLSAVRLLDTRDPSSLWENRLGPRQVIELPVQSLPGMPDAVWAVAANVTVVGATERGFLTVHACGGEVPPTSSLNFPATDSATALTISPVGAEGKLCVFASSRAHLIVDIQGVWVHDESLLPPPPEDDGDLADQGDEEEPEAEADEAFADDIRVKQGCATAGSGAASSWLVLLALIWARRR